MCLKCGAFAFQRCCAEWVGRLRLKCNGTRAKTRFRLSAKRTNPFKSAGASVQLTTGSRGVRISGSNAAYTMFRGSAKSTDYPLHSPLSPSLPLPCVTYAITFQLDSTCLYRRFGATSVPFRRVKQINVFALPGALYRVFHDLWTLLQEVIS